MEVCFRCKHDLVDITPDDLEGIQFFGCHGYGSHFTKNPGKQLCDRWLMPITLPLYHVTFEENPIDKLKKILFMLRKEKPEGLIEIVEQAFNSIKNNGVLDKINNKCREALSNIITN
jgi:hypothetical protein